LAPGPAVVHVSVPPLAAPKADPIPEVETSAKSATATTSSVGGGEGEGGVLYDVGKLPSELTLHWPARPFTRSRVEASTLQQFVAAASQSATHVHVTASLMGTALVKGSDIVVTMKDGVEIQQLAIDHGCKRVMLKGGRYGSVLVTLPAEFVPIKQPRPDWIIEDVIIDGVEVHAPEIAFEIYGKRIAIVRSQAHAGTYSVWSAPAFDLRSEDIVLAGNHFDSAGPEATVRLVGVVRSVTVDNVLRNTRKHNYRIHGASELAYAARNTLINTGAMLGTMDEDHIDKLWFDHNTFFQQAPDLFNPSRERIGYLHAEGNTAYDNGHQTFLYESAPGWSVEHNKVLPYRAPPKP
jgi:hypothetical protein